MKIAFNVGEESDLQMVGVLFQGLADFNRANGGADAPREFSLTATDDAGVLGGGAFGWIGLGVVHLDVLFVQPEYRGKRIGTRIMDSLEEEARSRGCQLVQLDTFSFQAPAFYAKRGYHIVATLPLTGGRKWQFLTKSLVGPSPPLRDASSETASAP